MVEDRAGWYGAVGHSCRCAPPRPLRRPRRLTEADKRRRRLQHTTGNSRRAGMAGACNHRAFMEEGGTERAAVQRYQRAVRTVPQGVSTGDGCGTRRWHPLGHPRRQ